MGSAGECSATDGRELHLELSMCLRPRRMLVSEANRINGIGSYFDAVRFAHQHPTVYEIESLHSVLNRVGGKNPVGIALDAPPNQGIEGLAFRCSTTTP